MSEIFSKILKDKNGKTLNVGSKYQQPEWGSETKSAVQLPETAPVQAEENVFVVLEPFSSMPVEGGVYTVTWNGTSQEFTASAFDLEGTPCIAFGNISMLGGDDTGDPFGVLVVPADQTEVMGMSAYVLVYDGSTAPTLSISGLETVVHQIDNKYFNLANSNIVNGSAPGSTRTVNAAAEDTNYAMGENAHAEGSNTTASGGTAHAEGSNTTASGNSAHAEGARTTASGAASHAEGSDTTARGNNAHAEGISTIASGASSHAEGVGTTASGNNAHAEGSSTTASGDYAHAEGIGTIASGGKAHAEGSNTTASGDYAHAEGRNTTASGDYAHAEGGHTIAAGMNQHVQGRYNVEDSENKYAHIIGNGTSETGRKNIHTVDWLGNGWYMGTLETVGGLILNTASGKRFRITVDDSGTLSATEIT